ncbi:MAG: hypothetical protein U0R80_13705 [Nocardioidaceae bacterium]
MRSPRCVLALALAGLSLVTVTGTPAPSAAAAPRPPCSTVPGLGKLVEEADAVFTATVVTSSTDTAGTGKKQHEVRRYTAEVDRVYQGKVTDERVLITSDQPAACGYGDIPAGRPWVFFVHGRGAKFFGNMEGGTGRATATSIRRIEKLLGEGTEMNPTAPPREPLTYTAEDTSDPTPLSRLVAPGAALTLIGLLGLVLFRRRPARA